MTTQQTPMRRLCWEGIHMESQRWSLKDHRHCFTVLSHVITFSRVEMLVDCGGGGGGGAVQTASRVEERPQ